MGLLSTRTPRLTATRSFNQGPTTLENPANWLIDLIGGKRVRSGVKVTASTSMTLSAIFAGVRLLSTSVGGLPINHFKRVGDNGVDREDIRDSPVARLLKLQPNDRMTPKVFRQTMMSHSLFWGNGYAVIHFDRAGRVAELLPLMPDRTRPFIKDGKKWFKTRIKDRELELTNDEVLHVPGMGFNGLQGFPLWEMMRETTGLGLAEQQFGAAFYGDGANNTGVIEVPGKLNDKPYERLRTSFDREYTGLTQAFRTPILEAGATFKQTGVKPSDAQYVSGKQFSVQDVARWLNVPANMIGSPEKATFNNQEQTSINYVIYSLNDWLISYEQEYNLKLIDPARQTEEFIQHNVQGLLRGDVKTRFMVYKTAILNGIMTPNEARRLENLPPITGGDTLFFPLNMAPIEIVAGGQATQQPATEEEQARIRGIVDRMLEGRRVDPLQLPAPVPETRALELRQVSSQDARERLGRTFEPLFTAAAARLVRVEVDRVTRAYQKDDQRERDDALEKFYEKFEGRIKQGMSEPATAYAQAITAEIEREKETEIVDDGRDRIDQFVDTYVETLAVRWIGSSRGQIDKFKRTLEGAALGAAVIKRASEWEATRAAKIGTREVKQQGNAVARESYREAGSTELTWVTRGNEDCPICEELDGTTVSIDAPFKRTGETIQSRDPDQAPIPLSSPAWHPPIHDGCDCLVTGN